MGAMNRAQRRKQEREQIRAWKAENRYEQVLSLQRNGITEKDLDKAFKNGYDEGYMYAAKGWMKLMYAAIAQELLAAGNSKEDVVSFLIGVDRRFAVMFDGDEELDDIYRQIGVRFNIDKDSIDRFEGVTA